MKRIFLLLVGLLGLVSFVPTTTQAQNASNPANWTNCRLSVKDSLEYTQDATGGFLMAPSSTQVTIGFTVNAPSPYVGWRQTAGGIYNSSGNLIRTLWTNRCYLNGNYGVVWDGKDDYGNAATGPPWTLHIDHNNYTYTWNGIIGSGSAWTGRFTQSAMISGFTTAAVFINRMMYGTTGYNEGGHFATFKVRADNPNGPMQAIFTVLSNTVFTLLDTDGVNLYWLVQPYNTAERGGVVATTINSQPMSWGAGNGSLWTATDTGSSIFLLFKYFHITIANYNPWPGASWLDVTKLNTGGTGSTAVTGIAVTYTGDNGPGSCATDGCIATAHGYYDLAHGYGNSTDIVASLNTISLWDKVTGAAISTITGATNPQILKFDHLGNLWFISGYQGGVNGSNTPNVLYEITTPGSSPTITQIGAGVFQNPKYIAISPTTGNLFIADGGTNQQIYEVNPANPTTIISTLGQLGGYIQSGACNPNIDPNGVNSPTFWFDPDVSSMNIQPNTPFVNWISIDDVGDLWIGDFFVQRILHYTKVGATWVYVNKLDQTFGNTFMIAVDPTNGRIFHGIRGMLEYTRNWNVPLQPGDPQSATGNNAWRKSKNWWVCIEYALGSPSSQYEYHTGAMLSNNGNILTFMFSRNGLGNATMAFQFNINGTFTSKANVSPPSWPDQFGNTYSLTTAGSSPNFTYTIKKCPPVFDANGFPTWPTCTAVATYTSSVSLPLAQNGFGIFPFTTDGTYPVTQSNWAATVGGAPLFHLGGANNSGTLKFAVAKQQVEQLFMTGDCTFPAANLAGVGNTGGQVSTVGNEIFWFLSGNNGPVGSNWMDVHSDGLCMGQMGWQTSHAYINPINTYSSRIGYPLHGGQFPYVGPVPGLEGDASSPQFVTVNGNIYMYVADQALRDGFHEFEIGGLSTFGQLSATIPQLGITVTAQ